MPNEQFSKDLQTLKSIVSRTKIQTDASKVDSQPGDGDVHENAAEGSAILPTENKARKISRKGLFMIIGAVAIVAAVVLLINGSGYKNVTLDQYVSFKVSGYHSKGLVSASVNTSSLLQELVPNSSKGSTSGTNLSQALTQTTQYAVLLDSIKVKYDTPNTNLKNGDQVKISLTYNEQMAKSMKIRFSGLSKTYVVSGLKTATVIDAFEGMSVKYSGTSPYASISVTAATSISKFVSLKAEKTSQIKNGDQIKVSATLISNPDSDPRELKASTTTLTISSLPEYLFSKDQFVGTTRSTLTKDAAGRAKSYFSDKSVKAAVNEALGKSSSMASADAAYAGDAKLVHILLLTRKATAAVSTLPLSVEYSSLIFVFEQSIVDSKTNQTASVYLPIQYINSTITDQKVTYERGTFGGLKSNLSSVRSSYINSAQSSFNDVEVPLN